MRPFHRLVVAIALLPAGAGPAAAQSSGLIPGPNVNMVSGTQWPDGDPFLQRQNEPSIAVSTRNPLHLLAGANDYRTVDLPGLPEGKETGDAWLGVFRSVDGGGSWKSTLVRGYPQDTVGVSSSNERYDAAADPVVRAGTNGLFYYSGIVFDRSLQRSAAFVARFMDLNNETVEPIRYMDTVLVDSFGDGSAFIDKPWLEVDIPRAGAQSASLNVPQGSGTVSQTIQCGNVYMAWAEITGQGAALRTRIMFSRSTDCGSNWSNPVPLSLSDATGHGLTVGQGATIAVAPAGSVYVAWRQFRNATVDCVQGGLGYWKNTPSAWPVQSIAVGGVTYSKQQAIAIQKKSPGGDATYILAHQLIPARLNVLAGAENDVISGVIAQSDAWLQAHPLGSKPGQPAKNQGLALKDQLEAFNQGTAGPGMCTSAATGSPDAILVVRSDNGGLSFSTPQQVATVSPFDQGTSEYSFRTNAYPTMAVDETGRVYLAWATRGLATPNADPVAGDARIVVTTSKNGTTWTTPKPIDQPKMKGHQLFPSLTYNTGKLLLVYNDYRADASEVFERFVVDLLNPNRPMRHTVDVRAAIASPADAPVFTDYSLLKPSSQVSRYPFIVTGTSESDAKSLQLQYNPPNLPMFEKGSKPFFGDYLDIAGAPRFVPNGNGSWKHNTTASTAPVFHAVWTDNRDVVGPPDGDWTSYVPPGLGGQSQFDSTKTVAPCTDVDRTQMRNQNIYTSRLTSGLFVAVPSNARPLSDSFQRAFVLFVQNATDKERSFRLEILGPPQGVTASFLQSSSALTQDVTIGAYSSISQPVFVESSNPTASVDVRVTELGNCGSSCLTSTVRINPDSSNPPPADPALATGETYNPAVYNPAVYNPAVYNPAVYNPAVFNPAVFNVDPSNPAVLNYQLYNPAVYNPAVLNGALSATEEAFNLLMMSLALLNPAVYNPAVFNPAVFNPAVFNPAVFNPAVLNPAVLNPAVFNPAVYNPAVYNPAVYNPAVYNSSLTEANYVAQNAGNTTMAYSFNLKLANPQSEPGLTYQLLIYRLYFVPVANGCELTAAAQQELLVNDLAPNLNANLLDPNGGDSFFLNPGDVAIATLRVLPDPNAPTPGSPSQFPLQGLSASVVSKGVNSDDDKGGDTQQPFALILAPTVPPLIITTSALPSGVVGSAYSTTLSATGGSGPRTWSVAPGSALPTGLALSASGEIAGTPASSGSFTVTVRVTDETQLAGRTFTSVIAPVAGGLTFLTQPANNTPVNSSLGSVQVRLTDTSGAAVPGVTITMTLVPNGNTGTLVPATAATNGTGVATFSSLAVTAAGSGYRLLATSGNVAALSNLFDVSSGVVPLRFAYQGTVDRADGYGAGGVHNPAPYAAFMGQTIRVEYTFDPATADSNPSAEGDYLGAIKTLTVTVGSNVYTATSGTIIIVNSPPQPDQYIVDVPIGLSGPSVGGVPVARIEIILTDPSGSYFNSDALPTVQPNPVGFSLPAIQLQFWDNNNPDPLRPYGIIQANNVAITGGGLTFLTQPVSTGPNASLGNVQVMAKDAADLPIPGVTVTMTLVPNGNAGTLVPPTSMYSTSLTGVATFPGLEVTAAGSGYRLLATSGSVAALSSAFDISAAGTTVWLLDNVDPDYNADPFTDTLTVRDTSGTPSATAAIFNISQTSGAWRAFSVAPSGDYALVAEFGYLTGRLTRVDRQGNVVWSVTGRYVVSVDISGNGYAYALTWPGGTPYGTDILKIDPANGQIVASASNYSGADLVVDDAHDAIWVVGDQIMKFNRDLALQVTATPPGWMAVSVDYAADGSVWVAQRQYTAPPYPGENGLLRFAVTGSPLPSLPLPVAPFSVRVDRTDGSAWVALETALRKYDSGLNQVRSRDATGWSVAVDPSDGSVWHAERNGTVTHLTRDGAELLVIPGAAGDPLRDAWLALGITP